MRSCPSKKEKRGLYTNDPRREYPKKGGNEFIDFSFPFQIKKIDNALPIGWEHRLSKVGFQEVEKGRCEGLGAGQKRERRPPKICGESL